MGVLYARTAPGVFTPMLSGTSGEKGDPGEPGGSLLTAFWSYATATATPPSSGQARTNVGLTELYLSETDTDGMNRAMGLGTAQAGDTIIVRAANGTAMDLLITGTPTDSGTYYTFPISVTTGTVTKGARTQFGILSPTPHGLPAGGASGDVLAKTSSSDYAADWVNRFGTVAAARNLDGDTGQFAHLTIVEDGTPTSTWPERIRFNYNNGTRTRRTFYLNEYGEVRCIPASDDTIPLRIFSQEYAADGVRDTSVPLFEIQDNRDDRNAFTTINHLGDAWFAGSLAADGALFFQADALAEVLEQIVLEAADPAPGVGVWLRKS